jgi:hypothetical protein
VKSAFYTASLVLGLLATAELFRRVRNRSGHRTTVAGAAIAGVGMAFACIGMAFADPLIVRPFSRATEVGLATYISGTAVICLLACILILLSWWIFRGTSFTVALVATSTASAAAACSMAVLFAQSPLTSKYTGTSLRLLVSDVASGSPMSGKPIAYACIYFSYVTLASIAVAIGFGFLALGARELGLRVRTGFWTAASAGVFGILYAVMSLVAIVSGAQHHLILPLHGTETATAFSVCGALAFGCGILIPNIPVRRPRTF